MLIDLYLFYFIFCDALNRPSCTQRQMLGRTGKNVKVAITAYFRGTIPHSYAGAEKIHKISDTVASV